MTVAVIVLAWIAFLFWASTLRTRRRHVFAMIVLPVSIVAMIAVAGQLLAAFSGGAGPVINLIHMAVAPNQR